jgi:hypothetical protein
LVKQRACGRPERRGDGAHQPGRKTAGSREAESGDPIDDGKIQEHLGEVVRSTVEETLHAMLDAEADRLCQAERYERTEARKDGRPRLFCST